MNLHQDIYFELKLYRKEFNALGAFLSKNHENVRVLKGLSLSIDVALTEWYVGPFAKRWVSIPSSPKPTAYKLKFPISVSMNLWSRFQQQTIPAELQSLLAEIDKQLTNNGFKPQ